MQLRKITFFLVVLLNVLSAAKALADTNCYLINECSHYRRDPSATPSTGGTIKINPSAVPTEKGYGVEAIYYKTQFDLSLVRGNGKVGAALSPSNSEETILGAPGFETYDQKLERKEEKDKYPGQKITLATAFDIVDKKGTGHRRYNLKLGVMGRYNKETYAITPGGGLSAVWGPFSAGYSLYDDQTKLDDGMGNSMVIKYKVQTWNAGIYLNSLILNYANLRLKAEDDIDYQATVHLYMASLAMGKFIFTGALRREDSEDLAYNYETHQLEYKKIKDEYFGGVQYTLTQNIMAGALYNYYLLREVSVSATLFF